MVVWMSFFLGLLAGWLLFSHNEAVVRSGGRNDQLLILTKKPAFEVYKAIFKFYCDAIEEEFDEKDALEAFKNKEELINDSIKIGQIRGWTYVLIKIFNNEHTRNLDEDEILKIIDSFAPELVTKILKANQKAQTPKTAKAIK